MMRLIGWFAGGFLIVRALSGDGQPRPAKPRRTWNAASRFLWKLAAIVAALGLLIGLLGAVSR